MKAAKPKQEFIDSGLYKSDHSGRVSFKHQQFVTEPEKIFHILGNLYLGSRYGALDENSILKIFKIQAIVNCCKKSDVPNQFENQNVEYVNFEIHDYVG